MLKNAYTVLLLSGALLGLGACSRETGQHAEQSARATGQFVESAGNDALANTDDAADAIGNEIGGDVGETVANVIETDTVVDNAPDVEEPEVAFREASTEAREAAVLAEVEADRLEEAARQARARARRARAEARRIGRSPR